MDPLLKSLSDSTFKQLLQEQRPEWAVPLGQGRPEVAPEPAARTPTTRTLQEIRNDLLALEREEPKNLAGQAWRFLRRGVLEARRAAHEELEAGDRGKPTSWTVGDLGMALDATPYSLGILVGAKGAQNLGGKSLYNYLLGKRALERGDDPLEVWKKYHVGTVKEGHAALELPLKKSVEGALEQFRKVYGNDALKSVILRELKPGQDLAGFYSPAHRQIYAAGDPRAPVDDFRSLRSVGEHELQHAADHQEGWGMGTTPQNLERPREDLAYWNNASEVRARAAQRRLNPEARELPFQFDEDVAREAQLVRNYPAAIAAMFRR